MPTVAKGKFNKTFIERSILPLQKSMEAGTQEYWWHPGVLGLALKLTPKKAVYIVQRRVGDKNTRIVIGNYRELTIEEAEEKASETRKKMGEGTDPIAEKKATIVRSKTLQQVLDDYLDQYDAKLRPKTKSVYKSAVRRCFADWLNLPITEIDEDMIVAKQLALSNANGPRGKGEAQANQAMRVLRTLINHAIETYKDEKKKPLITSNPVRKLKTKRLWNENKVRDEVIADDELAAWYGAVMKVDNEAVRDYMLLCLFTGLRRGEAAKLTWNNVQLPNKKPVPGEKPIKPMLTIPAADTKTNSEHKLPLPPFLVDLLGRRVRRIDSKYVFPGEKPGTHIVEPKRVIAKVIEESKIDFSMHTLRRTFGTIAGKLDIAHYKHKMLMNHSVKQDVTGASYVHLATEDLREPMQKICEHICHHAGVRLIEDVKENA